MARVGGRNRGIALFAGLVCAGVLLGLLYLAAPLLPVTVEWVTLNVTRAISHE